MTLDNVAVIVPTYNERKNIENLIKKIIKFFPKLDIFIVDDNSPDKTHYIVRELIKRYPNLNLLIRNSKSGRGGAVLEGFKQALVKSNYDYFIEMDADLSHSPDEIEKLMSKASKNTVVVGSRYVKSSKIINWPIYRRILSKLANSYIRLVLNVPISDFTNGFRSYPRSAVKFIMGQNVNHKGFITLSETAYILNREGFKFAEVPITFKDRKKGKSNATIPEILGSLLAVLQIRFGK